MSRWSDFETWDDGDLRREVFFFPSRGTQLYGSLYSSLELSRPFGLVACSSWGVEADRSDPLVRSITLGMAHLGGAAMVFHYPGYGDSYGNLASVGFADLVQAALDAVAEASRRRPGIAWGVAGFMLGAAVACTAAARDATNGRLMLVQPALRPGSYFRWLADHGKRNPLRYAVVEGMAYGYPLPPRMLNCAAELDAASDATLAALSVEEAAVIRYAEPEDAEPLPTGFERVEVSGRWRFGSTNDPRLATAAIAWLAAHTRKPVPARRQPDPAAP